MGAESMASLQRLADAAISTAATQSVLTRKGLLAQWRRRMEANLHFAAADAILNALSQSEVGRQTATRWCATTSVPAPLEAYVDGTSNGGQTQPAQDGSEDMQRRLPQPDVHALNSQICHACDGADCDLEAGLGDIFTADVVAASMPPADLLTADEEEAWHLFGDCSSV